jgi:hypothetical protein
MAARCTRVRLPQVHFARSNNLADVAAKESSQETAITLLGLVSGLVLASLWQFTVLQSWVAFLVLTAVHVVSNWRAVSALTFHTLNRNRVDAALRLFLHKRWTVCAHRCLRRSPVLRAFTHAAVVVLMSRIIGRAADAGNGVAV